MPEKRKYTRIQIRHPLRCSGENPGKRAEEDISGTVVNISPSGIMLETARPLAVKSIVLTAAVGEGGAIQASGEIIYCRPCAPDSFYTGVRIRGSIRQSSQFTNQILKYYFA